MKDDQVPEKRIVVIQDIHMSLWSMITFMLKLDIAILAVVFITIPAWLILLSIVIKWIL